MTTQVDIYTDGACSGNPGPGGWGAIMVWNGQEKELAGAEADTTNNRMELMAVIEALATLKRPCTVTVHTDSQYVQKGMSEWLPRWKEHGWKRKGGPIQNLDLWQALDAQARKHRVTWAWVKGHSGHPLNERADALAVAASKTAA
jgi:ribonuclease HI